MQLASDAALARAVDSADRVVVSKFEVDWNRDGLYTHVLSDLSSVVTDISLRRDAAGALPVETTIIEGFVGASLTVNLSGIRPQDTMTVSQLMSPLRTDSPLYGTGRTGTPCRWRLGLQTDAGTVPMVDQITGYIESCRVVGDNTVTLTCSDTQRLHEVINLPVYAMQSPRSGSFDNDRFRINSQWVIDYVLRRNGIYQSPPNQPGCIYSATGHGTMIPEIGHNFQFSLGGGSFTEVSKGYIPGRWGGIVFNANEEFQSLWNGRCDSVFQPIVNTIWTIQFQALWDKVPLMRDPTGTSVVILRSSQASFDVNATTWALRILPTGQLQTLYYNGTTLVLTHNGPTIAGTGWKDVWVRWTIPANLNNCTIEYPGQTSAGVNLSGLNGSPTLWPTAGIIKQIAFPVQNLQICNATGQANTLYDPTTFVSQCDLDAGLNEFASLPVKRGVDSLELLRDVVNAEYGVAGFNEQGRFFFKNRDTVRRQGVTVEKIVTPDPALITIALEEKPGAIRNVITTRVRGSYLDYDKYKTVFSAKSINDFVLHPGSNEIRIVLDEPTWVNDLFNLTQQVSANWDTGTEFTHEFVAVDSSFNEVAGVDVRVATDPAKLAAGVDEVILRVYNPSNFNLRFSTINGTPALKIGGLPAVDSPEVVSTYRNDVSISRYGPQTFELPPNEWRQIPEFVQPIATGLRKDLKQPIPLFDSIQTVGDPRLQLLDTLELSDVQGLGGPVTVGIEVIERKLTNKLEDNLTVRMLAYPGRWILGHSVWSILGSTTILG